MEAVHTDGSFFAQFLISTRTVQNNQIRRQFWAKKQKML
jgi:hypothetical protein